MAQRIYKPRHRLPSANNSREFNGRRDVDNLYDHQWEKFRAKFLAINTRCYACGKDATVADHLRVHRGNERLFYKPDNIIPLCQRCHNRVTTLFDKYFREGCSIDPKIKWLNSSRLKLGLTFKVKVVPWD